MSNKRAIQHRDVPNHRQWAFAKLIVEGLTQSEAYQKIYNPHASNKRAAEQGHRVGHMPAVVAEIERIRAASAAKTLLTVNDQLALLAEVAQAPARTAGDRNARARAIEVYARIAGTQAPERHEVTGKDGAPIPVAASVTATVTASVTRMPVTERIRLLRERREAERAARQES